MKSATQTMSSRLETVPRDILQLIAVLSASGSSVFDAPVEIQRLLLTSSYIYRSLHIQAASHVFAQIFYTKFDTAALFRRYGSSLTHSLLAAELSNRYRLLQRARRMDLSPANLTQDLWAALWLIVESDGLNERQLSNSNFPAFILELARDKLRESQTAEPRTDQQTLQCVILLSLCLTLPRRFILDMSKEEKDELYGLIYPFIFMPSEKPQSPFYAGQSCNACPTSVYECSCPDIDNSLHTYLGRQIVHFPDTCFAAINLASVIYETKQLKVPYHLPETRAIANATQRTGPTMDDFKAMLCYKTPLFADRFASSDEPGFYSSFDPRRSMNHDLEFGNLLRTPVGATCLDTLVYSPGTMTGVWEGIYRAVDMPAINATPTFTKAMQFALTEYICVSSEGTEDCPLDDDIHPCSFNLFHNQAGNSEIAVGSRRYQKYSAAASNSNCLEYVIILGQTLEDHDQAWNGYRFTGRIHKDGLLVLKREAKAAASTDGIWLFEGRLHFGTVIVGRWRMSYPPANAVNWQHGIFSLGKAVGKWKK